MKPQTRRLASTAASFNQTGTPDQLHALVDGILDPGTAVDTTDPATVNADDKAVDKSPTITAVLESQTDAFPLSEQYSEETRVRNAVDSVGVGSTRMSQLADLPAKDRARTGALYGGGVGIHAMGPIGGVVGAAIGAVAGRSSGIIQSGELEDNQRKDRVVSTLGTLGISDSRGIVDFEDGGQFFINPNPTNRLENTSAVSGSANRSMYEVDASNPFSNRAVAVAKPLAYFLNQGLLEYKDPKNPRDRQSLENTTGLLVNALQSGAQDVGQIYTRAKELTKKLGVSKAGMQHFFDKIKHTIPDEDAAALKQGLDVLFVGE